MVQADAVTVVRAIARALRLAQAERAAAAREVPDRLAALALDLADAVEAERREQLAVERQAALDRRDDEVDVVRGAAVHVTTVTFRVVAGVSFQKPPPLGSFSSPPRGATGGAPGGAPAASAASG